MRIGIDIDGVLTNIEEFIADYEVKFCYENNLSYRVNLNEYDEAKALGISAENCEKFWNKYLKYYAKEYRARDFASEVIKKLKEEGHEIYIVTARNEWGLTGDDYGKMKQFVKEWLKKNNIYYDKIVYTEETKLPYCVGNYIDIMIEDKPENVKEISTKMPVLCYNCNYNADVKGKNITRVYSWYDIYNKINGAVKKVCQMGRGILTHL